MSLFVVLFKNAQVFKSLVKFKVIKICYIYLGLVGGVKTCVKIWNLLVNFIPSATMFSNEIYWIWQTPSNLQQKYYWNSNFLKLFLWIGSRKLFIWNNIVQILKKNFLICNGIKDILYFCESFYLYILKLFFLFAFQLASVILHLCLYIWPGCFMECK